MIGKQKGIWSVSFLFVLLFLAVPKPSIRAQGAAAPAAPAAPAGGSVPDTGSDCDTNSNKGYSYTGTFNGNVTGAHSACASWNWNA